MPGLSCRISAAMYGALSCKRLNKDPSLGHLALQSQSVQVLCAKLFEDSQLREGRSYKKLLPRYSQIQ